MFIIHRACVEGETIEAQRVEGSPSHDGGHSFNENLRGMDSSPSQVGL